MDFKDLVYGGRSFRRFDPARAVTNEELLWLADLGRMTPRARNAQWIHFGITNRPESCQRIFPELKWASMLPEWGGPSISERPTAYVLLMEDTQHVKGSDIDLGIVSQTILLGARSIGLGGCHILAFNAQALSEALAIPSQFKVRLVLALGKPTEEVELRSTATSGSENYWREGQVHCVPKADLNKIVINL